MMSAQKNEINNQKQQIIVDEESNKFKFSMKELLTYFGPGLLVSIAYLDPGNLAGDMDAGLVGKYSLLWVLLLSTTLGYLFQVKSMKLGLVTGKDLAKLGRKHLPKKERILLWVMAEIAIMGSDIQEVLGSAIGLKILFNIDLWIGVLLTIFTTFIILLIKVCGMRKLEIVFAILIGIMSISFFVNVGQINPNPVDVLKGTVIPIIPSEAILASVALMGAVLMPHNLYLHSALVNEKGIDKKNKKLVAKSLFYFKIETALSLLLSFIISGAVISTFAHFSEFSDEIDIGNAGDYLAEQFGTSAKYIWGLGLLASGQSATLTGTLSGQYVMTGYIKMKISNFYRALLTRTIAIIPSFIIAFLSQNQDFNSSLNLLQAIQLPFAIIPLLKFSNCTQLMGSDRIGRIELYILSILSAFIVFANYYTLIPSYIDFQNPLTYLFGAIFICYFIFLVIIIRVKINTNQSHKQYFNELEQQKNPSECDDLENVPQIDSNKLPQMDSDNLPQIDSNNLPQLNSNNLPQNDSDNPPLIQQIQMKTDNPNLIELKKFSIDEDKQIR